MLVQNIIATIFSIGVLVIARDKPPTPPSATADQPPIKLEFKKEIRELRKNKSYLLLVLGYATLYGTVTAVGTVINSLTKPYNYTIENNSLFGAVFIVSGILGSIVIGVFLDKTHKFKLVMISVSISAVILLTLLLFTLPSKKVPLLCINLALLGFAAIPLTPIAFGLCVELTYPAPEAFSNGMMLLPSKVYGSLLALIASFAASSDPRYSNLIFIANAAVCLACSLILKEELRRLKPKEDLSTSPLN